MNVALIKMVSSKEEARQRATVLLQRHKGVVRRKDSRTIDLDDDADKNHALE